MTTVGTKSYTSPWRRIQWRSRCGRWEKQALCRVVDLVWLIDRSREGRRNIGRRAVGGEGGRPGARVCCDARGHARVCHTRAFTSLCSLGMECACNPWLWVRWRSVSFGNNISGQLFDCYASVSGAFVSFERGSSWFALRIFTRVGCSLRCCKCTTRCCIPDLAITPHSMLWNCAFRWEWRGSGVSVVCWSKPNTWRGGQRNYNILVQDAAFPGSNDMASMR